MAANTAKPTQAEAIMALVDAVNALNDRLQISARQQHLDAMVDRNELWHCCLCDRYFTYFQQIPVCMNIVVGEQHKVCHECYDNMQNQEAKQ